VTGGPVHSLSAEEVKDLKLAVRRLTRLWKQRPNLSPERAAQRKRLIRVRGVLDQYPDGCELRATEPRQAP
jgi:transcriptional regulator GlxA family with amidase domain